MASAPSPPPGPSVGVGGGERALESQCAAAPGFGSGRTFGVATSASSANATAAISRFKRQLTPRDLRKNTHGTAEGLGYDRSRSVTEGGLMSRIKDEIEHSFDAGPSA